MVVPTASGSARLSPHSASLSRRRWFLGGLLLLTLAAVLYVSRDVWLTRIAAALIHTDPLEPAEIVVVLAGDRYGHRILKSAELVELGYAPRVLVNGPMGFYGLSEASLSIDFAVQRGAPREIFEPFPMDSNSTMQEAQLVDAELRRRGVRQALVVTSDFHTRRARYIFQRYSSGTVEYFFRASRTQGFDPERWWHSREGRKVVFLECLKSVHSRFE